MGLNFHIPEPVLWVGGTVLVMLLVPLIYRFICSLIYAWLFFSGCSGAWNWWPWRRR